MLYTILKNLLRFSLKIYFRDIKINGLENIHPGRPMLIASNHPNAFLDAIALAAFSNRKLHFLARSDVFNTPVKRLLLQTINIMPIYRLEEGADKLHKNTETFEKCIKLLQKNAAIIIFPEGLCIQERRLRKLRKGMARIAFGSMEAGRFELPLQILPVGINYSKPSRSAGDLVINFGKPVQAKDYISYYQTDKARAINKLTLDVEAAMAELIVHIPDIKSENLIEGLEKIFHHHIDNGLPLPLNKRYLLSRKLVDTVVKMQEVQPERILQLENRVKQFLAGAKGMKIFPEQINKASLSGKGIGMLIAKMILLAAAAPVFIAGAVLNYIPYQLPYQIARKIVKNIEFFASVNYTVGTFLFQAYYAILAVCTGVYFGPLAAALLLLFGPLSGIIAFNYLILLKETKSHIRLLMQKVKAGALLKEKIEIIKEANYLKTEAKQEENKIAV
jgi:glycerol-3-phosphate O-acyltransferase / dihydroxyacetone phosphate acyltransferase